MAAYNMEHFRDFIFNSSFLTRYSMNAAMQTRLRAGGLDSDVALLRYGMQWLKELLFKGSDAAAPESQFPPAQ